MSNRARHRRDKRAEAYALMRTTWGVLVDPKTPWPVPPGRHE